MDTKLHNILSFTIIFLSGDLNLLHQSPDYFMEKFNYYFGDVKISKHDETNFYKKYKKIWGDDYRVNSIFLFLDGVLNYGYYNRDKEVDPYGEENWEEIDGFQLDPDEWTYGERRLIGDDGGRGISVAILNISRKPEVYFDLFNEFIGNFNDIKDEKMGGLHHVLKRELFDVYKKIMK